MIDFTLQEEEQLLADTAARFASEHLRDAERDHEKAQSFPDSILAAYAELGLADLNRAESGLEPCHRLAVWSALAEADPAAPFGLDPVGPGGAMVPDLPAGTGAFCTAEGLEIVDGTVTGKVPWIPRHRLDWLVLVADDGLFLVHNPNCQALADRPCGLQACGGVEVVLENTPCIPIGDGEAATAALAECRRLAATVLIGAAQDAHNAAAVYAQERVVFGRPIAHHQGMAFQLADAATDLEAARLLVEASTGCPTLAANAHALAVEVADRVCERSVQALGGHGYLYDHRVEKRMRDVRCVATLYGGVLRSEHDAALGMLTLSDPLEVDG
jgi:alkylation response protein AidB-like acyl-CoA dehydrogenase